MRKVGIIGAGQMGSGIAQVCASAGFKVVLSDLNEEATHQGLTAVQSGLARLVRKGTLDASEASAIEKRISSSVGLSGLVDCDLVIEAATEQISVKQYILKQLDAIIQPQTIVGTNTSSVSITKLGATLGDPSRFIGLHFFNPVPILELVEIVRGVRTSAETHDAVFAFATAIGKKPISVRNSPGFLVNRVLVPMVNEAIFALQEGVASAEEIDVGLKLGANHPIGPLALADLIGLDTTLAIMEVLYRDFNDSKYRPAPLLRELVDAGRLGRKNGRGFFDY